jgi:hypothetical protein
MFASNLRNYVFRENRIRLRHDRISLVIAFGFCLLMLALGQPKRVVAIEGVVVLGFSMFSFTLYFCNNANKIMADIRGTPQSEETLLYRPVSRRLASISMAVLLMVLPLPVVEAGVLNRRLLRLTRDPDLKPRQAEDVSSALAIARAIPINLPDTTRIQVYRATKISGLNESDSRPIVKSADEIVRYSRDVTFRRLSAELTTGSTDARVAYRAGANYVFQVLSGPDTLPTSNLDAATEAKKWLSRAIELSESSGHDPNLLIGALVMRATISLYTLHATDALADAARLESVGYTDLSNILAIEGVALNLRRKQGDLERAVRVFNLAIQLEPPVIRPGAPFLIDAFGNRSKAYYGLGQFTNSIRDSEHALELIRKADLHVPFYLTLAYSSIVASNLRLGNIEQAKLKAEEWLRTSNGDPAAREAISQLESAEGQRLWIQYKFEAWPRVY